MTNSTAAWLYEKGDELAAAASPLVSDKAFFAQGFVACIEVMESAEYHTRMAEELQLLASMLPAEEGIARLQLNKLAQAYLTIKEVLEQN